MSSSGINGLGTTSGIVTKDYAMEAGALTPDAIEEYCNTQLNSIDQNIDSQMNEQSQSARSSEALSDLGTALQGHADGFHASGTDPSNEGADSLDAADQKSLGDEVSGDIQTAINNTTDPQLLATLKTFQTNWNKTIGDGNVSAKEVNNLIDSVKDAQSDLSTNQQMAMIQIQSLVSQRQQAIQMTTNMLQTFNDSTKAVITNINQ